MSGGVSGRPRGSKMFIGGILVFVFLIIPMTSNLRNHSTALVKLPMLELSQTETGRSRGFGYFSYTSEKNAS
ncbi:hypothetical protein MKX03_013219 [Papaver bracteatum]|nr:hypothetical protein MKX03_013219 [Papaver bracteatum]